MSIIYINYQKYYACIVFFGYICLDHIYLSYEQNKNRKS